MNAQNAHEYLPLVQALANGKQLQYRDGFGNWGDTGGIYAPYFEKDSSCYRIKPEPRTFEMWLSPIGTMYPTTSLEHPLYERITVQEVL